MWPSVSVVIRNRNEGVHLRQVLRALARQGRRADEVIIVDNESSDGSPEIARQAGARIVGISRQEFSYGGALNRGIAEATGSIVILLSAHSYPIGAHFLVDAIAPFEDPAVAAATFRTVGGPAGYWTEPRGLHGEVSWKDLWWYGPSNYGCALRRSVWEQIPFEEQVEAAEDKGWAQRVLRNGYAISASGAFIWYMRLRPFWEGIRTFRREQVGSIRVSGQLGEPMTTSDAARALGRQIVLAGRGTLEILLRWFIVHTAAGAAKRAPRLGSVR
jgi:glycosyltransferase involved in cell wall biosynthesis